MAQQLSDTTARQELVQPSLWDRLLDELPGVVAETESLRAELSKEIGEAYSLDQIVQGGTREIEKCADLGDATRQKLYRFVKKSQRRQKLEETGILVDADTLREAVRRDIEMLFNIERMEAEILLTPTERLKTQSTKEILADFPHIRSSVINYGVPSFSGRRGSDFDKDSLERDLRQVLQNYEPRLKANSVKVKVTIDDKTGMRIGIDGILQLSPVPERLRLSTAIDLDNGQAVTSIEDV